MNKLIKHAILRDERDSDLYLGSAAGAIAGGGIGYIAGGNLGEQTGHKYLRNLFGRQHDTEMLRKGEMDKALEYLKAVRGTDWKKQYVQGFRRRGTAKGMMVGIPTGALIGALAGIGMRSSEITPPASQVNNVWYDPNTTKVGFWHGFSDELQKLSDIQSRPGSQQYLLPVGQMKRDKLLKSMSYNRNQ